MLVGNFASDYQSDMLRSWKLSRDGRTLTFRIKPGLLSHDGNELTARDFQWSADRSWASNQIGSFYWRVILNLKKPSWRVVDKYTWQISAPRPNVLLQRIWVGNDLAPTDSVEAKKHATKSDPWATKWLATHLPGWGPYKVVEHSPGERDVLAVDPNWAKATGRTPSVKEVIYKQVPVPSDRMALLQSGAVDVARQLEPFQFKFLEGKSGINVLNFAGNIIYRVQFNNAMSPFKDRRVRIALSYATDYTGILSKVFYGLGKQATSPVPSTYPAHTGDAWHYSLNIAKARSLLKQAGYPNGFSSTLYYDSSSASQEQTAIHLKTSFADAGVKLNLVKVPSAAYYTEIYKKKWPLFFYPDYAGTPDGGAGMSMWLHTGSSINQASYHNPRVDSLLDKANATQNVAARSNLLRQAQRLIVGDAPWIFIAEPGWQLATRSTISNIQWTPYNTVDWSTVRKQ
jgi:peptide/nickel transport system substrate-binding protein